MQCVIPNTCADRALCCNFCKKLQCRSRCKDDFRRCKYFDDVTYDREAEEKAKEERRIRSLFQRQGAKTRL